MHTMRKITLALALTLLLSCLLTACGGVRDDVPLSDLAAAVEAEIEGGSSLVDPGAGYIAGSMKLDTAALGEYVIKISAQGTSINEYGVFKAADEKAAKALVSTLEDYLAMRIGSWMPEYLPEEFPKLENAEVKQEGLYVVYGILSETEREAAFSAFEDMLKK